jgi:hypothetical protein
MRRLIVFLSVTALALVGGAPVDAATSTTAPQWTISPSQNPGLRINVFGDVSALSATDAWAVGYSADKLATADEGDGKTLVEHWDGQTWTLVASPSPGLYQNGFNAVLAIAPNDVWAAGYRSETHLDIESLVEHWDGSAWSVVAGPSVPGAEVQIFDLARVPGSSKVVAVGSSTAPMGFEQPFAARWNGTTWETLTTRTFPEGGGRFQGVAAVSGNDVMAVGGGGNGGSQNKTLGERFDGSRFRMARPINPFPGVDALLGISRVPGTDHMWAVGTGKNHGGRTLAEYWDGSSWTVYPTPPDAAANGSASYLFGVASIREDLAWAVGFNTDGTAMIEKWDGAAWSIAPHPATGGSLFAVTRVPGTGQVWAVGYDGTAGALIEHFG